MSNPAPVNDKKFEIVMFTCPNCGEVAKPEFRAYVQYGNVIIECDCPNCKEFINR